LKKFIRRTQTIPKICTSRDLYIVMC